MHNLSVRVDEEGRPVRPVVRAPHELLRSPHPEGLVHRFVRIRQQVKPEPVLRDELRVARRPVCAHAEHFDSRRTQVRQVRIQVARLRSAAGRVVFRIEVQREGLARVVRERTGGAVLDGAGEGRGRGAGCKGCCHGGITTGEGEG